MDEPDVGQVEVGQVELATQEASTHLAVRSGSGTRDVDVVAVVVIGLIGAGRAGRVA
jgi:hypothetical protein